jgi:glycine oxidase
MDDEKRNPGVDPYDVIVVGAGVIGLSVAWCAARKGLAVCVVERSEPGAGASSVAAGMLAPVGEASFGEEALLELSLASHVIWPEFSENLSAATGLETGFLPLGALHVAFDGDEAAEMQRKGDLHERLGLDSSWLSPDRCRELEPRLAPNLVGGLYVPGDSAADPRQLVTALQAALHSEGVEIVSNTVPSGCGFDDSGVTLEIPDGAPLLAKRMVLAAGAWSGDPESAWLPEALRAEVRPVKGQIVELAAEPPHSHPVAERIVCGERFYAVPRSDGSLVIGATVEEKGFDTGITAGAVHELLREGYRALPDLAELRFVGARAGLRPATPDNAPLLGSNPIEPRLLYATGHFRNGILLAPVTGEVIASLLVDEEPDLQVDLDLFRPDRFIKPSDPSKAVTV